MKKFLPFLFPLIALIIVGVLIFRWYNSQTANKQGKIPDFAAGTQIEQLSSTDSTRLKKGAKDLATVDMKGGQDMMGEIRYEVKDGKVLFSVIANLPPAENAQYQVWLQEVNGEAKKKAFVLAADKGGYIGSGSISADTLPFEVVVSLEKNKDDDQMETVVLRGVIQKEAAAQK